MKEMPKREGDSGKVGSLRIPQKDELPEPAYQFPSDVVFIMNRWYDPFLSYHHKSVYEMFSLLEKHLRGEKEKMQFKKDYTDFQKIKTTKSFMNSIDDFFEIMVPLNPHLIVFYKLLFGNYESGNGSGMSKVYADITANSVYSRMEHILSCFSHLEHKPQLVLTSQDDNSKGNTHLISAESMVIKKVKSEYPETQMIRTRSIPEVVASVNKILEKKIKSASR